MVSENIKIFRMSLRLDQNEFSVRVGVSKQTISNWERGYTKPDIGHVLTMIDMGASIDYLLFGKGSALQRLSA